MLTVALKGLAGRKLRASLTAISIVLGVAMISGTYVLTDTINNGFNTIFTQSYQNADVVITGKAAFDSAEGNSVEPPSMPQSLLPKIQRLPGVALAAGSVTTSALKLIGKDGKVISTGGAPSLGFSVTPSGQPFNPTKLTEGRWPHGGGEVVIDKATASGNGFHVGDRIGVQAFGPAHTLGITGIAEFPGVSVGGATFAILDQPTAQLLFHKPGQLDAIRVQSKAGVKTSELVSQIRPLLGPTQVVRTGTQQAKRDQDQSGGFIKVIKYALLAFAGIALFVGAFVIANTLAITIAQRTREFATLRTLGASRRQVMWSVVIEAFVIGVLGSVAGLFLGLGIAKLLNVRRDRDRPPARVDRLLDADDRGFPAGGHARDALREHQACPPGDARPADRGRARGLRDPALTLGEVRHGDVSDRARARHRARLPGLARRRDRDSSSTAAARGGRPAALRRRLDERVEGRPAAGLGPRRSGRGIGRRAGDPRARQRDAEPCADCLDRLGIDDRARARHLRRHLRPGHPQLV
ncbi:MAG: ABC transporter permease, partial [Actinobacteria bacterium]